MRKEGGIWYSFGDKILPDREKAQPALFPPFYILPIAVVTACRPSRAICRH